LTTPAGKKKKKRRKRRRVKRTPATENPSMEAKRSATSLGVGVEAGWEAPYGNGATVHLILSDFIDLNGGIGYNNSGLKVGAGAHLLISMGSSFALRFGASLVNSQGRNGDVSLEAKFIPEGSSSAETVEASKDFEVSSAFMVAPSVGAKLQLGESLALIGGGNYNVILSGNEVTFKDDIRFNKNIELTNQDDFDGEFQDEAKDLVQAGGLGFYLGVMILM
jgi:hypothetical protein